MSEFRNPIIKATVKSALSLFLLLALSLNTSAESGYDLWLRYHEVADKHHSKYVQQLLSNVVITAEATAIREELIIAAQGMVHSEPVFSSMPTGKSGLFIATAANELPKGASHLIADLENAGAEGYIIAYLSDSKEKKIVIAANTTAGALYGTFHLLRLLQSGEKPALAPIIESPKISHRLLNHWDNLDRTVERGYAGFSIWDWHRLPGYKDRRYTDYARANASVGINGTVLTNVNANALVLTPEYIEKVTALADIFRPYGIKVYLTARFSAPIEIGGLATADPLNREVQTWWNAKAEELYRSIPDFGGFLVKANSEGQPGPQNYGRTHADGANMLADAVAPFGGIVIWRAFVYSDESPDDRAKQANNEFGPLDGMFRKNVVIQVKNGAIDFQPREPFHPLFGAMDKTALALELQITQEYLGQATNLAFLAPMYKECMDAVTYRPDKETKVSGIIDGTAFKNELSVIAGVSNIGNDMNWTGHPIAQSNWYAFGRLAWNHQLSSAEIADEWINATYGTDQLVLSTLKKMMLHSHQMVVNYMTPLGLHHIMGRHHHYGPGPWVTGGRADWTSPYYHRASKDGIGFNRTSTGSNALEQYAPEIAMQYENPATCPEKFLLWFHHLPWNYKMKSGNTLWDELCYSYDKGVKEAAAMIPAWASLEGRIDQNRYKQVSELLNIQLEEAKWWRNSCLLYFQEFSELPFPSDIEQPEGDLEEYRQMQFPFAPGIRPAW